MLNDSRMWKGELPRQSFVALKAPPTLSFPVISVAAGARNIYHQLLMNSVLMDLKFKKIFAIQFAKVSYLRGVCGRHT